jgi:rubrerythrin
MVVMDEAFSRFVRFVAPFVWRSETKTTAKFRGFSATEAGSALDMLKAAELENDPRRRRLFFRHALDEARHSNYFRDQAKGIDPDFTSRDGKYNLIHATRQNLYQNLCLTEFVAFVYIAEKRGEAHFRSLMAHFKNRPAIHDMFTRIVKDEQFHVRYSKRILDDWSRAGRGREVKAALRKIQLNRAWGAWRRQGRRLGDLTSRLVLKIAYFVVVPPFSLMQYVLQRTPPRGWKEADQTTLNMEEIRRMF